MTISAGLMMTHSAQAQLIPLSGVNAAEATGAAGAGWLAGSGPAATFASGPSVGSAGTAGIEVQASAENGYGFSYFDLGSGATTINPNATEVTLTFTINGSTSGYNWLGVPLTLNDGTGTGTYGGKYSAPGNPGSQPGTAWNGNTGSITWALNPAEIAIIQGGGDTVYGFNTGVDPSSVPATYDLTFNSLNFTAVPEPATMALFGLSAAGLLALRRRK